MSKKAEEKETLKEEVNKTEKPKESTEKNKKNSKEIESDKKSTKKAEKTVETIEKKEEPEIDDEVEIEIEETDIIAETIKTRKKMPQEIKDKITDSIFFNIIMVILMMIINLDITVLYVNYNLEKFETCMKFVQIGVCLGTIGFFEYAYRKDSFKKALYGIEFLIFSITVLYVPYMYVLKENLEFMDYVIKIFVIYYIIKSLAYFIYTKVKFSKDNLSDVKEIVKKEEKEGYLDD